MSISGMLARLAALEQALRPPRDHDAAALAAELAALSEEQQDRLMREPSFCGPCQTALDSIIEREAGTWVPKSGERPLSEQLRASGRPHPCPACEAARAEKWRRVLANEPAPPGTRLLPTGEEMSRLVWGE